VKTDGDEVVYLAASGIDLVPHVDKKVTVTGTAFVTGCSGTLYLPCDFLSVTSIELSTPTATERMTWGAIKSLFE
jgi:hypothetical protein